MKAYGFFVAAVIVLLALFGFILPALFSAKSTEAVLVGGFILAILPVVGYGFIKLFKGDKK